MPMKPASLPLCNSLTSSLLKSPSSQARNPSPAPASQKHAQNLRQTAIKNLLLCSLKLLCSLSLVLPLLRSSSLRPSLTSSKDLTKISLSQLQKHPLKSTTSLAATRLHYATNNRRRSSRQRPADPHATCQPSIGTSKATYDSALSSQKKTRG